MDDCASPVWSYTGGNFRVQEIEHLFGYDLILSEDEGGCYMPRRIITRTAPLTSLEKRFARRWCEAYADMDWAVVTAAMQTLSR